MRDEENSNFLASQRQEKLRAVCDAIPQPVALTGATGFVGGHVLEALVTHGCQVRVLVRNPVKLPAAVRPKISQVVGDLCDEEAVKRLVQDCKTVLHVAGLVRGSSEEVFTRVNAKGTARLVQQAEKAGRPRFIYVSSLAAAGPASSPQGKDPQDPPQPVSAYGRSKLLGEKAVKGYGGSWLILRPPAIYGPGDRDVFTFFRLASFGVLPYPAGHRLLTVAFVNDVVTAILAAAASTIGARIFHLGEPRPYDMRELLQLLAAAGEVRARLVPLPSFIFRLAGLVGDGLHLVGFKDVAMTADKARELIARHWVAKTESTIAMLGLSEPVSFAEGAKLTWAWYRQAGWLDRVSIKSVKKD